MNGPNEIKGINAHRTRQALEDLRIKAVSAKQQNHPNAEKFERDYHALAADVKLH